MTLKFVARQAIFDDKLNTIGYELLYRDNMNNTFDELCNDKATSQVIIQNHLFGNLSTLCGGKKAFINFHDNTLLQKFPLMFDKDSIVVELLETVTVSREIIDVVIELHAKGYTIALDDYDFLPQWDVLLPYISIIKLDIEDISYLRIEELKVKLKALGLSISLLAERVEELEQYEALKNIGVNYFQGYYFHKPELKTGTSISPLHTSLLLLCAEVYKPDSEFDEITRVVRQDVTLTSGVLKLVNSAGCNAAVEITSIKQAVSFLGLEKIKQYVSIISMSQLSSDSPNELFIESLIRAKAMENISISSAFKTISHLAFITGMLSHLDAILQVPMCELIIDLPLDNEIKQALLKHESLLAELLSLVKVFETKKPHENTLAVIEKHNLPVEFLCEAYQESLTWYEDNIN